MSPPKTTITIYTARGTRMLRFAKISTRLLNIPKMPAVCAVLSYKIISFIIFKILLKYVFNKSVLVIFKQFYFEYDISNDSNTKIKVTIISLAKEIILCTCNK